MADETLLYTASFDPTGIVQGEAVAAKAFNDLDKSAAKAFTSINTQATTAKSNLGQVGGISKDVSWQIKNAGFQVSDFFVQLASGQGVIRPLLQQSNQLIGGFGMWGSVIAAGTAILGALYIAMSDTTSKAKEFGATELPDWMVNTSQFAVVQTAMHDLAEANLALTAQMNASGGAVSEGTVYMAAYSGAVKDAAQAEAHFKDVVGISIAEFQKKITQIVDFNTYVKDTQERANAKLLDIQDENAQERIKAKKDELEKLLGMEAIAYDKSIRSTRAYYSAIRDDIKQSDDIRKKAAKDLDDALNVIANTHVLKQTNITDKYNDEQDKKDKEKTKKATDEAKRKREAEEREAKALFKTMADLRQQEVDELRSFQATKADVGADLGIREVEAGGDSIAKLAAHQARETQALQKRLDDQTKNLDLSIAEYEDYYSALDRLAAIHAVEREKVIKDEADKNKKQLTDAAKDAARAWESLGMTIADALGIGPLKTFLTWLEKIVTVAEDLATIKKTSSILGGLLGGLFGGGTIAGFVGGGEGPGVLATIAAVAKRGADVPSSDYTPPGALAKASGTQQAASTSSSITVGDVHVHVPVGTPTASIGGLVKSAVVEAAQQIESLRNQRYYNDGTLAGYRG